MAGVSQAIIAHRDLKTLFHVLADQIRQLVCFDHLALFLHDELSQSTHVHVLEGPAVESGQKLPPPLADDESPLKLVLENQKAMVVAEEQDLTPRWPRHAERLIAMGVHSTCYLPLTTSRGRLGVLGFGSKKAGVYDHADIDFLQQVANQVAVAVENALACEEIEALKEKLHQEKVYLEEEARVERNFEDIIGENAELRRVLKQIEAVAPTDSTVLICGETGTGKELIARALHDLSPRRERTLVKLNCAAIPSGLLESELFGHEKGAFTGAIAQKLGRFELAHRGTLFLDEVGDVPPELQPKLLRVLQDQEFERLGSTKTLKVNVRLVAATNVDLERMVQEKKFRSDLFYRLNVFPVRIPPLRERRDDIPSLVQYFMRKYARRMGTRVETVPAATMRKLVDWSWPGNVRELQNMIERGVILSKGFVLEI